MKNKQTIIYGIPNCDTTKKAIKVLKKNNIDFAFHDYKLQGIDKEKLCEWIDKVGLENIFNKRSTTWKELSKTDQEKEATNNGAIEIMIEHNSIIKRPIIEANEKLLIGFNENNINQIK